jgi:NADH-quinone oxidoreductase subunit E
MPLLIIQLAILVAVAFIVGCVLGKLFRGKSKAMTDEERIIVAAALSTPPAVDEKPESVQPVAAPVEAAALPKDKKPQKVSAPKKAPVPDAEVVGGPLPVPAAEPEEPREPKDPGRPELLDAPREDKTDDLTVISGIGKAIQTMLNKLGVYHYDQIASWSDEEAAKTGSRRQQSSQKPRASPRPNGQSEPRKLLQGRRPSLSRKLTLDGVTG